MRYPFETLFLVCTGARCNDPVRGDERGEIIRDELKDLNKSLGRKATVRICAVSCLDLCDYGPNIVVHPSGDVFSGLDRERSKTVYREVMAQNSVEQPAGEERSEPIAATSSTFER